MVGDDIAQRLSGGKREEPEVAASATIPKPEISTELVECHQNGGRVSSTGLMNSLHGSRSNCGWKRKALKATRLTRWLYWRT